MTRVKAGAVPAAFIALVLSFLIAIGQHAPAYLGEAASTCRSGATRMARLELLFGLKQANGREVTENDWQAFIDKEVTPRFPQGLTVMAGSGQWQSSRGAIAKEPSRILVVWYQTGDESEGRIEAIRGAYKVRFDQESVMRVDSNSCVSF
jgi:Protein of unknown function (DUF3574)